MSELINKVTCRTYFRKELLTTVCAIALLPSLGGAAKASADDSDRPTVWVELGGQLEALSGQPETYSPPFLTGIEQYGIRSPFGVERPPSYGFATEGSISFEPSNNGWIFSAAVRYGRSAKNKSSHQQTANVHVPAHFTFNGQYFNAGTFYPSSHVKFSDAKTTQRASQTILDFQAGKDVGLGIFGGHGSSVLSAGVRFAQFSSKANIDLRMEPDVQYPTQPLLSLPDFLAFFQGAFHFHDYAGTESENRSFRGIGPSVAWTGSTPFRGDVDRGELTLDWGVNAAVLFGRQKANGHHQTTARSYYKHGSWGVGPRKVGFIGHAFGTVSTTQHSQAADFDRSRTVAVPNVGGFAGVSYRYSDARLSLGYRADFFFGAMDGGIDTRQSENVGFFGPFATISIGLGG